MQGGRDVGRNFFPLLKHGRMRRFTEMGVCGCDSGLMAAHRKMRRMRVRSLQVADGGPRSI
jgi:hypothetical protein